MTQCRVCSDDLVGVLDLGNFPLANAFVSPRRASEPEPAFPLGLSFCSNCKLVQLTETVDPAAMFSDYLYTPGASATWHEHCADLAQYVSEVSPVEAPFVVEVGSNDGTFLKQAKSSAGRILGVDPAANIAEMARRDGVPTETAFFGAETAERLVRKHGPADVVVGTNVVGHTPDLPDFLRGVAVMLTERGVFVIEVPYLRAMLDAGAFDTVYHEHVSYFSVTSMTNALERAGLRLVDVGVVPTHAGSLRVLAKHASGPDTVSARALRMLHEERADGLNILGRLLAFQDRVSALRRRLLELFAEFRADDLRVVGYGATAKGNILLNYVGLGPPDVAMIGDRNQLKQGLFAPGTRIPIVSPEEVEAAKPDVIFVLAWNLVDEIREQFRDFAEAGGRFLVPVPQPTLVGGVGRAAAQG